MSLGFRLRFSTQKQHPNSIVLKDTKASCRGLDRLNPAVESGGRSVADRVRKPCHDSIDRFSSIRAIFLIGSSLLRIVDGYHDSKKVRPPIASVSCQRHRNSSYRLQERLGAVVLFRSASRRFKQQILHLEVTTCDDPARIQAHQRMIFMGQTCPSINSFGRFDPSPSGIARG